MRRSPAFQFYPQDFLCDEKSKLMSLEERGVYITLLCHCWIEGSLPIEIQKLAVLCNVDAHAMQTLCSNVLKCFAKRRGRYVNPRLEQEFDKQKRYRESRSDNAKSGWDKRKEKFTNNGIKKTHAEHMHSTRNAFQFSSSINKESFNQFWSSYPKKRSVGEARKAWNRLSPDPLLLETILESLERAKQSKDWQNESGKYIPHAATWLRAEGWKDEYEPEIPKNGRYRETLVV